MMACAFFLSLGVLQPVRLEENPDRTFSDAGNSGGAKKAKRTERFAPESKGITQCVVRTKPAFRSSQQKRVLTQST